MELADADTTGRPALDGASVSRVVTLEGLDRLIVELRGQGRTVLGPTVRDGVITHGEITNYDDLPRGWTEEQNGGTYRLESTGSDEVFAFSTASESWKRFVLAPRTLLIRGRRGSNGIEVHEPLPETPSTVFFGIRACDLAGLGVLDRVMLDPAATDPTYAARRSDVFVVAAACSNPGNTCFCASMGTGPSPSSGFDLAIAELRGRTPIEYLISSGSDRGALLLDTLPGRPATKADHDLAADLHKNAVAAMHRSIDPADPPKAANEPEHPRWADVATRCLACGNCTMVCPTCFCSTTEDTTSLDGVETERWRVWDSCFALDFTHIHGGSTRSSTSSLYRQWLLHKLATWHDQFGTSGCVGCGRCITWCPVGIDLTVEIAALADHQEETPV